MKRIKVDVASSLDRDFLDEIHPWAINLWPFKKGSK